MQSAFLVWMFSAGVEKKKKDARKKREETLSSFWDMKVNKLFSTEGVYFRDLTSRMTLETGRLHVFSLSSQNLKQIYMSMFHLMPQRCYLALAVVILTEVVPNFLIVSVPTPLSSTKKFYIYWSICLVCALLCLLQRWMGICLMNGLSLLERIEGSKHSRSELFVL